MRQKYQIFKGDKGIVFMRFDTKNISKVSVVNENYGNTIKTFTFRNIPPDTFQSPYVSWNNLNCCNGWTYDENYLFTAVQTGKKLCAGITLINDEQSINEFANGLSSDYPFFRPPNTHNGPNTLYHIDVTRKGSISDFIDMQAIKTTYAALGIDFLDFDEIDEYTRQEMLSLLDGTITYDYGNPKGVTQFVVTGLLLGYPLESTAALLTE